eukprot:snap_masked-scaffold_14-processed-gene-8.14-mRNA-1 protein AED:0.06 eAED:0.12 QI:0/-1/0/1/-1/1/1/0/570
MAPESSVEERQKVVENLDSATENADLKKPWAADSDDEKSGATNKNDERQKALAEKFKNLSMNVSEDKLKVGDLIVRLAGSGVYQASSDPSIVNLSVTSFTKLPLHETLLHNILTNKNWTSLSRIQQIGLPIILSSDRNFIGQAQAGTGKTGTFVISTLTKILPYINQSKINSPLAIILATTQELVTQITSEVMSLSKGLGVRVRRVMSARAKDGSLLDAPWALKPGQDYDEHILVGTVGMVKQYLGNAQGRKPRKPMIDVSDLKVLVLDEADHLLAYPPVGFGKDVETIKEMIMRRNPAVQTLLFSATFDSSTRRLAQIYSGNTPDAFSEVVLKQEDLTLDKVVNFFVLLQPTETMKLMDPRQFAQLEEEVYKQKFEAILDIWSSLAEYALGQTVIFVKTKARARQLGEFLESNDVNVGQIHGDMPKDEREKVFAEFKKGTRQALVATNILSRGIDNPNVTLVINVDFPEKPTMNRGPRGARPDAFQMQQQPALADSETFVHRIGRSGRWTKKGASVSLVTPLLPFKDIDLMKQIEEQLFMKEDGTKRPLIQVQEPSFLGEALAEHLSNV